MRINQGAKRRRVPYSKFKAWMQEHGIRQKDVAALLGKSETAFSQNLSGSGGDLSMEDVRTICREYGISADTYFVDQKVS